MQRRDRLVRWSARSDVQTAWITGAALFFAVLLPGLFVYAFSASESLEEIDRWFEFVLQVVTRDVEERGDTPIDLEDVRGRLPDLRAAVQVHSAGGELLYARGRWPDGKQQIPALSRGQEPRESSDRPLHSVAILKRSNWMVGERTTRAGERVRLALPLRHFASESAEIRGRVIVATAVAAVAVLAIGLASTMRAFSPLRRATALLRDVDTGNLGRNLGLRLPTRRTGDPIDLHAETLNSVLARIDAGFSRLRAFSSDVAHELRTPLNRISTVSEVALLAGDAREQRAALEAVLATTEDLARVVQALLLLAEIDDRRLALRTNRLDVRSWIDQHVEAYAPSFEDAGVKLACAGEDLVVEGDRVLLHRIIANLLDNALSHAPGGSRVEIHSARSDGGIAITVDDAGPGIPTADRERIFDRFARLDGAHGVGHGLGLALARAIAELHGGRLDVSESPLGGARFELWLPDGSRQ